jgi:hypothetical protein
MTLSPYDRLSEADQDKVSEALGRCSFGRCNSTLDSVAADILRVRARRDAAKPTRTDNR